MTELSDFDPTQGINGPLEPWLEFNAHGAFATENGLKLVAPFPPPELMVDTSGLSRAQDFAMHGLLIARAFAQASPSPLRDFKSILDFGVGVGRLARMFKGFKGAYIGVDIDPRNIEWVMKNLSYVTAVLTLPRRPLPFGDAVFDAVISVSVFTHMNAKDCGFYIRELKRVVKPGGPIMASLHGARALQRAHEEARIKEMLALSSASIEDALRRFNGSGGYCFVPQRTHLTRRTMNTWPCSCRRNT